MSTWRTNTRICPYQVVPQRPRCLRDEGIGKNRCRFLRPRLKISRNNLVGTYSCICPLVTVGNQCPLDGQIQEYVPTKLFRNALDAYEMKGFVRIAVGFCYDIYLQNRVLEIAQKFAFLWAIRALEPLPASPKGERAAASESIERGFEGLTAFQKRKTSRVFDCYFGVKKRGSPSNGASAGLQRARRHVATAAPPESNSSPVATPRGPYGKPKLPL